jgi:hypothetical protein
MSSARSASYSDSYLFGRGLLLVLFATALDVWNYLDRGGWPRYLILLIPLGSIVLLRLRRPSPFIQRPNRADRILFVLLLIGLTGTIYGILVRGTPQTALPIFAPMLIAFLYMGCLEEPTGQEARTLLRGVEWLGILYIALGAVVSWGLIPGLIEYRQFRNASLLFVALGFAAAATQRHWGRAILILALWAIVFAAYPSGTSALVLLTVASTLLMVPLRPSRIRPYLFGAAAAAAVFIVLLNFNAWVQLTNDYFSLVGKSNNNSTRLAVWTVGMDRFEASPIYGELFSGPTVTTAVREGGRTEFQIPYHSDYIQFLANGGLLGFGLLIAWIIATELVAMRRSMTLIDRGERSKANLLRTLLVGYNAFFVTAAFNPTIMGVSRSASIFSIYSMMMILQAGRRDTPA